jgi:hypothetical protein
MGRGDRYRVFAELRILKDFKSFVLELQILKGLEGDFSDLQMIKDLREFLGRARRCVFAARQAESVEQVTPQFNTEHSLCQY